jgi:hypothetical protein
MLEIDNFPDGGFALILEMKDTFIHIGGYWIASPVIFSEFIISYLSNLKVLSNENRGGSKLVPIDPF